MKLLGYFAAVLATTAVVGLACIAAPPHAAAQTARRLTLEESIQAALADNPDLLAARSRVALAHARLQNAGSAFYPTLRVSESYTITDNPVQAFMMTLNQRSFGLDADFNDPDVTDNFNTRLLASYELYNGGRDVALREAARLGVDAQEQSLEAVRNDLALEVVRAFHAVAKARRIVTAREASLQSMQANIAVARARFERGAALKADLLDAEVGLAAAREALVRARSELAMSETTFRQVLGVGDDEPLTAGDTGGAVVSSSRVGRRGDAAEAGAELDLARRPEWIAAQAAVDAAERRLRAAVGGRLPRVNALAGYDLDSGDADAFEDSWLVAVSVELDVFDGFRVRSETAEARARLSLARDRLRGVELALRAQVRRARLAVDDAVARLQASEQAADQAQESLQIAKRRYAEGAALLARVLDSEAAWVAARQSRISANADFAVARAALGRALGEPWQQW